MGTEEIHVVNGWQSCLVKGSLPSCWRLELERLLFFRITSLWAWIRLCSGSHKNSDLWSDLDTNGRDCIFFCNMETWWKAFGTTYFFLMLDSHSVFIQLVSCFRILWSWATVFDNLSFKWCHVGLWNSSKLLQNSSDTIAPCIHNLKYYTLKYLKNLQKVELKYKFILVQ